MYAFCVEWQLLVHPGFQYSSVTEYIFCLFKRILININMLGLFVSL